MLIVERLANRRRRLTTGRMAELVFATLLALLLALDLVFPPPIPPSQPATVVVAADGTPLRTWPGEDGIWRHPVSPDNVSPLYLQALLAYEDRWFHWHFGINPVSLVRAGWQWARSGRVVSGGSTLTMQVARLVDPPPADDRRTLAGKARQMARALQLELRLSKREILALYLDRAPMGGIVEGVEMASRAYLGKPSSDLGAAEAAMLAALPQAPSRLRPDRHRAAAQAARDKVLDRMAAFEVWPPEMVADARSETLAVQPLRARWLAPLAAQRLRSESLAMSAGDGARALDRGNSTAVDRDSANAHAATLRSTLDVELQTTVERLLLDRVNALPPKVSIAALVVDNDTLEVKAYAGSADFGDSQRAPHVDMVRAIRSPGSTLKPFLYGLALDDGLVHSESLLIDAPQSFAGYQPGNFQAAFSGPVSVSEALQKSLNVPAVDILERIGPARFAQVLRAGGLRLRMEPGAEPNLSLILGGGGTTLEELVGAYRALARGGLAGTPRLTPTAPRTEARLMSAGAAFIVRDILEGGGHPDRPFAEGPRRLAWKTGTSFGFRDAWAVGVTEGHTVGVWVGRPDGTPNPGFFGANTAAPLLHDIASALPLAQFEDGSHRPDSVTPIVTCWPLGLRAESTEPGHCLVRRSGWALHGGAPPTLPDRARSGGLLVSRACAGAVVRSVRWPVALEPWVAAPSPPGECAASERSPGDTLLRIVGLESGAELRPVPGAAAVEVTVVAAGAQEGAGPVIWLVDGRQERRSEPGQGVRLQFREAGLHTITALDGAGRHHRIEVGVSGL